MRKHLALITVLLLGCGAQTPKGMFGAFVDAVRSADADRLLMLDAGLRERTAGMFKTDRAAFAARLKHQLALPAATATIERGFADSTCDYAARAYFTTGSKVTVTDAVKDDDQNVRLQVQVEYPESLAPVYVTDVSVVWNEPPSSGGLSIPAIKPIPLFSEGVFEPSHPFLVRPTWRSYSGTLFDLELSSRPVRRLTLTVALVRDEKSGGWSVASLQPDFSGSEFRP